MNGNDTARLVAAGLMIALVASSLFGRQLKFGETLRMALAWCAIFALAFVAFLFRDEARAVWSRVKAEVGGGSAAQVSGTVTRIQMSEDGHFNVRAKVNGQTVDFLIDSGATTTGLSADAARASCTKRRMWSGLPENSAERIFKATDRPSSTSRARKTSPARIGLLEVGSIRQTDARAVIGKSFGDTNVLGMSFLSELKSWKVEGRTLTLEP